MEAYVRAKNSKYWLYDEITESIVGFTLLAPLDRVKTILQTEAVHSRIKPEHRLLKIRNVCAHIFQKQGILAFWRGNLLPMAMFTPTLLAMESSYAITSRDFNVSAKKHPSLFWAINSLQTIAYIFISVAILYPVYTVKVKLNLEMGATREFTSIYDCFTRIRNNPKDMYRGLNITLPFSLLVYEIFDRIRPDRLISVEKQRTMQYEESLLILIGLLIGFNIIVHPIETVIYRLMVQAGREGEKFSGPMECVAKTFSKEGFRGFYNGFSLSFLRLLILLQLDIYYSDHGRMN